MYAHDVSLPFRDLNRFSNNLKKNILKIRNRYYLDQLNQIEYETKLKNEAFHNHLIGFNQGYKEAEKKYKLIFSYLLNLS
jgi:hypothetical protein